MKKAAGLFACLLLAAASLLAEDLTIAFKTQGRVMGMSINGTQTHYYSARFQKTVDAANKQDSLVDYEKAVFYTIHHKKKKIETMTFDDMAKILEAANQKMAAAGADMPAFMRGMLGGGDANVKVKVEKAGSDTVVGRSCQKYHVTAGKLVWDQSSDPSLKMPISPAALARFTKLRAALNPMGGEALRKLYEELSKIQGVPLRTTMKGFMGGDTTTEATEVKVGPIPAATFALPAGYTTEDTGKRTLKQMQHEG